MERSRLILAINAAELAGHTHYAQSLRHLLDREIAASPQSKAVDEPRRSSESEGGRPLFFSVQGTDFGHSIKWAQKRGNPVNDQVREHRQRVLPTNPHP